MAKSMLQRFEANYWATKLDLDGSPGSMADFYPVADMWIYGFGYSLDQAITTGYFTGTAPIASITTTPAGGAETTAIKVITQVKATAYAAGQDFQNVGFLPFKVKSGDKLSLKLDTAGATGTTTGTGSFFLYCEFFPPIAGA